VPAPRAGRRDDRPEFEQFPAPRTDRGGRPRYRGAAGVMAAPFSVRSVAIAIAADG